MDTDEIKATLEGAYDEVCAKVKETEGTDEEVLLQAVALNIQDAIDGLDLILSLKRQERELAPDFDLSFPAEGDFK